MKVRAIHAIHGLNEIVNPGEVFDLAADEAKKLAAIGAVELLELPKPSKTETSAEDKQTK